MCVWSNETKIYEMREKKSYNALWYVIVRASVYVVVAVHTNHNL